MGKLVADQLTLSYDSTVIIDGVDLKIEEEKSLHSSVPMVAGNQQSSNHSPG